MNEGKHKCPHCDFRFETLYDLKMHLLSDDATVLQH